MADPSPWVYTTVTLTDPEPRAPSPWVYTTVTIRPPHHPIRIKTADGWVHAPL